MISWQRHDLNPIENLWAELKESIHKQKTKPENLQELGRIVKRSWKTIPISMIEALIDSMPDRIQAIIAAERDPTKY